MKVWWNMVNKENNKNYCREKGVAFFPTVKAMSANPYWPMLATELEKAGFFMDYDTPASFNSTNMKWLIDNHNRVKVLNLHFIQQFYLSHSYLKSFILVLLFGFSMLLARILGYRTVFTLHNLEPTYEYKLAWLDYLGHWIAANLSERVIVYCNESRRLFEKRYGYREGIFFVDHPNVIDYYPNTQTKESARKKLSLPNNSTVFTFIGGVRPNKGIETLIQAFLKLEDEDIRLVIAGNVGRPEAYAQSLVEMASVDNRISFHLKFIPEEEIQIFMKAADIVVLPFAKILTSGTAILAMSFARPVVVPRMGCLPELVESDFGWLFEPDNVESLSVTMDNAMRSDYQQVGQNAYQKISAFTPERFAAQTIKAYWE